MSDWGISWIANIGYSLSPASEVKGVRSVSETSHKINDSWLGGKLSLILFQNLFLSTGAHTALNICCNKNLRGLNSIFPHCAVDGWHWSYLGVFPIDLLNKTMGRDKIVLGWPVMQHLWPKLREKHST